MKLRGFYKLVPVMVVAMGLLSACGKQKYQTQKHEATATANQYSVTKPKIDIVVFQDNSDSVMYGPVSALKPEMHNLLNQLSNEWDFHFVVLPLLYDQNSLSGKFVVASNCADISGASGCFSPSQTASFNAQGGNSAWLNTSFSAGGSLDYGFYYMQRNLSRSSFTSSGFLRADAALAVIVISNGEDLSVINTNNKGNCTTGSGHFRPDLYPHIDYCNSNGSGHYVVNEYSSNLATGYNSFKNYFASAKPAGLRKFYSIVSPSTSCYGAGAFPGYRYMAMSGEFGSTVGSLCGGGFTSVLNNIRSNLQAVVQAIEFDYAVIADHEPLVSSIVVKKNGVTIPQSSSNGWTYVGYLNNQPTSYFPAPGNNRSGYMVRLHGSARYKGSDVITITYERK